MNVFPETRALPSCTRDFTLSGQHEAPGAALPPRTCQPLDGAPVASLRSRILRPGAASIGCGEPKPREEFADMIAGEVPGNQRVGFEVLAVTGRR